MSKPRADWRTHLYQGDEVGFENYKHTVLVIEYWPDDTFTITNTEGRTFSGFLWQLS